jgi:hypothetical protein
MARFVFRFVPVRFLRTRVFSTTSPLRFQLRFGSFLHPDPLFSIISPVRFSKSSVFCPIFRENRGVELQALCRKADLRTLRISPELYASTSPPGPASATQKGYHTSPHLSSDLRARDCGPRRPALSKVRSKGPFAVGRSIAAQCSQARRNGRPTREQLHKLCCVVAPPCPST